MVGEDRAQRFHGGGGFHIDVEPRSGEGVQSLSHRQKAAVVSEQSGEFDRTHLIDSPWIAGKALKCRVMEEHDVTVCGDLAVGLYVLGSRGMSGCEGGGRVVPDTGILARRGEKTTMGEDSRMPRLAEIGVRHTPGGGLVGGWPDPGRGVKAVPMPLSASVSSLGMIHSLLDWPSLIFGSICRY